MNAKESKALLSGIVSGDDDAIARIVSARFESMYRDAIRRQNLIESAMGACMAIGESVDSGKSL